MNGMKSYRIALEPENDVYAGLLNSSLTLSSEGLLVVRDTIDLAKGGAAILTRLRPFIVAETRESRWPGTMLLDDQTASIFRFSICADSVNVLLHSARRLYDWQQPERPEDLGLVRANGTPFLISIAHESEAYLVATDNELERLRKAVPNLGPLVLEDIGDLT